MSRLLAEAFKTVGVTEHDGPEDNPIILQWARELGVGNMFTRDSQAWCTLWLSCMVQRAGLPLPKRSLLLWSMAYAKWGTERVGEPQLGDVVVTWRGKREQQIGHVRIFLAIVKPDTWLMVGGNQQGHLGDDVSIKTAVVRPELNLVSVRVPPEPITRPDNAVPLHIVGSPIQAA
jgi:uncharacterized protein (TIGR02594 family)